MTTPNDYLIIPSILSANFAKLSEEIDAVIAAGADSIHFDVMDHHYVPNLTIGPLVCQSLRDNGIKTPIDVHLMVTPVNELITEFAEAGATRITIHPEASRHLDHSLQLIKQHHCLAGLALNPATPLDWLDHTLYQLDMVLVMTVNPGFGGQPFIKEMLPKIEDVRRKIEETKRPIRLAVDGGINKTTIQAVANAGADTFIMGSAIFKSGKSYTETIRELREQLA
jgi:ribulose-phosphate 3-epimerase